MLPLLTPAIGGCGCGCGRPWPWPGCRTRPSSTRPVTGSLSGRNKPTGSPGFLHIFSRSQVPLATDSATAASNAASTVSAVPLLTGSRHGRRRRLGAQGCRSCPSRPIVAVQHFITGVRRTKVMPAPAAALTHAGSRPGRATSPHVFRWPGHRRGKLWRSASMSLIIPISKIYIGMPGIAHLDFGINQ